MLNYSGECDQESDIEGEEAEEGQAGQERKAAGWRSEESHESSCGQVIREVVSSGSSNINSYQNSSGR